MERMGSEKISSELRNVSASMHEWRQKREEFHLATLRQMEKEDAVKQEWEKWEDELLKARHEEELIDLQDTLQWKECLRQKRKMEEEDAVERVKRRRWEQAEDDCAREHHEKQLRKYDLENCLEEQKRMEEDEYAMACGGYEQMMEEFRIMRLRHHHERELRLLNEELEEAAAATDDDDDDEDDDDNGDNLDIDNVANNYEFLCSYW